MSRTFENLFFATLIMILCNFAFADRPGRLLAANNNDCRTITTCTTDDALHLKGIFLELNPDTGDSTQIGILSNSAPSLAFSENEGKLFASFTVLPAPAQSQLFLIDPDTTAAMYVGVISNAGDPTIEYGVAGMGFTDGGQLYGIDGRSNSLLKIDHTTAQATPVGTGLGFDVKGHGGTIRDGIFYLLSGQCKKSDRSLYS